jgi:PhzF family phenazine biosynthesis protein
MNNDMWIIDAFTPVAFRGNPAAVVLMDTFLPDAQLQRMAAIANLSETAFVVPVTGQDYKLRWFTPTTEVKLCGHATLAAAHALHQAGKLKEGDTARFDTLSGMLTARILKNGIELNLPNLPGKDVKAPAVLKALGVDMLACQRNDENFLVEVKNFDTLLACKPNFKKLANMGGAYGVIVTTAKGVPGEFDFASRYFATPVGVDEDPVTGSAHCMLAPYWAAKLGKTKFHALQASKGHGILDVTLSGDRVLVAGQAVTSLRGTVSDILPTAMKEKTAC